MKLLVESDSVKHEDIVFLHMLLPQAIANLPITVHIVDDPENAKPYLAHFPSSYWQLVHEGHTGGTYDFEHDYIVIYTKNLPTELFMIGLAFTLFHEWRHAYQYYVLRDVFLYEYARYNSDTESDVYNEQWAEQDANYFANQMLTLNHEMLSIYTKVYDWQPVHREPAPRHHLTISQELVV